MDALCTYLQNIATVSPPLSKFFLAYFVAINFHNPTLFISALLFFKNKRTRFKMMNVSTESHVVNDMEEENIVESDSASQRSMWEALKKRINGLVKEVIVSNVRDVAKELLSEDLIWGRGLFCSAILKSSAASLNFAPVFACLVAAINSRFPDVGYLLLKRILNHFKIAFERKDKPGLLPLVKLLSHLLNQGVVHELIALELLSVLLQNPTKDSIEVAVVFVQQCGSAVYAYTPRGLDSVFERFNEILGEGDLDERTVCLIEGLFAIRRSRFSGYIAILPELDIVDLDDQVTHEISLFNEMDPETFLDLFRPNPQFRMSDDQWFKPLNRNIFLKKRKMRTSRRMLNFDEDPINEDETETELVNEATRIPSRSNQEM